MGVLRSGRGRRFFLIGMADDGEVERVTSVGGRQRGAHARQQNLQGERISRQHSDQRPQAHARSGRDSIPASRRIIVLRRVE